MTNTVSFIYIELKRSQGVVILSFDVNKKDKNFTIINLFTVINGPPTKYKSKYTPEVVI